MRQLPKEEGEEEKQEEFIYFDFMQQKQRRWLYSIISTIINIDARCSKCDFEWEDGRMRDGGAVDIPHAYCVQSSSFLSSIPEKVDDVTRRVTRQELDEKRTPQSARFFSLENFMTPLL